VDDLDPAAQAGLLRAIEEREIVPLGETRPRRVDFRLVASSAPDLRGRVAGGGFREDLYYRINVVELELPPLRDRPEDIPLLARLFLDDCARRFGKPLREVAPAAMAVLEAYDWPGNVRELQCAVEAAAASARGETIGESDLPVHVRRGRREPGPADPMPAPAGEDGDEPFLPFAERVEAFQRSILIEALGRHSWSHIAAARDLGLERHQLKYLCAKLGIRRSLA
jgi:two-component system response regulator HydG